MNAKTFAVFMIVLGVIALLGFGVIDKNDEAIAVGDTTPEPELTVLGDDEEASLADYRGRWVLLNFWSSWCEPCREESPDLQAFQLANPEIAVVGVNLEDATADAADFVSDLGLTYDQLRAVDGRALREAFGSIARPENFLIDPEGRIALVQRGAVTADDLEERFVPVIRGEA